MSRMSRLKANALSTVLRRSARCDDRTRRSGSSFSCVNMSKSFGMPGFQHTAHTPHRQHACTASSGATSLTISHEHEASKGSRASLAALGMQTLLLVTACVAFSQRAEREIWHLNHCRVSAFFHGIKPIARLLVCTKKLWLAMPRNRHPSFRPVEVRKEMRGL